CFKTSLIFIVLPLNGPDLSRLYGPTVENVISSKSYRCPFNRLHLFLDPVRLPLVTSAGK
ncbi:MAG: hypothetical protein WAV13_08770, partial [Thermodesulfovibrionales bacterium]